MSAVLKGSREVATSCFGASNLFCCTFICSLFHWIYRTGCVCAHGASSSSSGGMLLMCVDGLGFQPFNLLAVLASKAVVGHN